RLVDEHRLANIPRVLVTVRRHGGNVSARFQKIQRHNSYRALQASLERGLKRPVPFELVVHLLDKTLPSAASATRALAALHCELFQALTRAASPQEVRRVADDLSVRFGVLSARALLRQPSSALALAARGARHSLRACARGFAACRRGDPHVYRRSP